MGQYKINSIFQNKNVTFSERKVQKNKIYYTYVKFLLYFFDNQVISINFVVYLKNNQVLLDYISKPHSFEIIKIELLDFTSNSSISVSSHSYSQGGSITSVANILHNVEKSYDKGKFLLEESKKK